MDEIVLKNGKIHRGRRRTKRFDKQVEVKVPRTNGRTVRRILPFSWVSEMRSSSAVTEPV